MKHIYVIAIAGIGCKVGIARDPQRRLKRLRTGNPFKATLYWSVQCEPWKASTVEHMVHQHLSEHRLNGEWFSVEPESAKLAILDAIEKLQNTPPPLIETPIKVTPVRAFRLALGMTQSEFGKAIGATQAAVSNYELGKRLPSRSAQRLINLARRNGYTLPLEIFARDESGPVA
jgi:DNA-binding transcriptional regulator YiaG